MIHRITEISHLTLCVEQNDIIIHEQYYESWKVIAADIEGV